MSANTSKDVKTVENDYTMIQRGSTPPNIKQKCHSLCGLYLGGVWTEVSIDDIEVKRLSGGFSNQLYYCGVNEDHRCGDTDVPQEVVIILYQEKLFKNVSTDGSNRLKDTVVALMMSEHNLGPKVYGISNGGQIMSYHKHKNFRTEDQNNPKLVTELAQKLAKMHAMSVPIRKSGNSFFDVIFDLNNEALDKFDLKSLIDECDCKTLKAYDMRQELEWLKRIITETDSPIAFSHIDFRGSNIMVTESDGIVFCDFEHSSYNYRGYDFGSLFMEWGRGMSQFAPPTPFPSDPTIMPFIESYIEESVKLLGEGFRRDDRNSCEHILKEVKVFSMYGFVFFANFNLKTNEPFIPGVEFDKKRTMTSADFWFKLYIDLKDTLIRDKLIVK